MANETKKAKAPTAPKAPKATKVKKTDVERNAELMDTTKLVMKHVGKEITMKSGRNTGKDMILKNVMIEGRTVKVYALVKGADPVNPMSYDMAAIRHIIFKDAEAQKEVFGSKRGGGKTPGKVELNELSKLLGVYRKQLTDMRKAKEFKPVAVASLETIKAGIEKYNAAISQK